MREMGEPFNMADESIEHHIVTLFEKLEGMRREGQEVRVPARLELRSLALWRAAAAECAASFLYVFIVCGAAGGAGVGASASAVLLATALASGCAVAALTLCFANISGAHINPAVSAALCVRRRVSPLRALLYVAAQCGGGIAGAAAVLGVSVPGYAGSLSAALPVGGAWERLGAELVLSALVTAAYFAAAERRLAGAAPALLGAAYCAATFVSLPSLNPARALGPAFVLSRWESHWVSWAGGLGGGAACALLHEWGSRRARASSRASSPALDDDKPAFPAHFRHAPTYCAASAPRPDHAEPLYSGTKSLYCRSPPPARHPLHRSQSVYSKGSSAAGAGAAPLVSAQSLLLRTHAHAPPPAHSAHSTLNTHTAHNTHSAHNTLSTHNTLNTHTHAAHTQHALTHSQNAHNAQRDPAYGIANGVRPGPAGAATQERRESLYGARRGALSSEDSAYGSYSRAAYRAPDHY